MAREDAEAHRTAVVLHKETEAGEAFLVQKTLNHVRGLVKGVCVLSRIWQGAVAEAGIIHRDDMELVRQRWNQIAVLMR